MGSPNQQSETHRVEDGLEVWLRKHCAGADGLRPRIISTDLWEALNDTKGPPNRVTRPYRTSWEPWVTRQSRADRRSRGPRLGTHQPTITRSLD